MENDILIEWINKTLINYIINKLFTIFHMIILWISYNKDIIIFLWIIKPGKNVENRLN